MEGKRHTWLTGVGSVTPFLDPGGGSVDGDVY